MRKVFISHSSANAMDARLISEPLQLLGCESWMAPRDIAPGREYPEAIMEGIAECRVFLLLLSQEAQQSNHVIRELEHAVSFGKKIIPVIMGAAPLTKRFEYYLKLPQCIKTNNDLPPDVATGIVNAVFTAVIEETAKTSSEAGTRFGSERILFEIRSNASLSWLKREDRQKVPDIIDSFAKSAPGTGLSLVGMNFNPLTVQFSSNFKGFEALRRLFFGRKIPGQKEFNWNGLERLDAATAVRPLQAPFCSSEGEELPDDFKAVVCHLVRIEGFEDIAAHARQFVGESTSDLSECRIYLHFGRKEGLYAHSNYVKDGCEYATKLFISKWMPLMLVFGNLVSHDAADAEEWEELENSHANCVKYFVADQDLPDAIEEFFCGAQNVEFVEAFVGKEEF